MGGWDDLKTKANTCCFLGHREIQETEELRTQLYNTVKMLIVVKGVDTFLFGSKSQFDSLCYDLVTELKEKYPHIKRIDVRAEFPVVGDSYQNFLLEIYEDSYFPSCIYGAGRAVYVERNREMVDKSQFCIFYYREDLAPKTRKSGTKIAYEYALKRKRTVYTFPSAKEDSFSGK